MIVDSHQHFWQVGRFDYPWMTPEVEVLCHDYLPPALAPMLERNEVKKTILVQASNSLEETRWLLKLAEQNSFIAGVVGWVDLTAEGFVDQLDEFTAHKSTLTFSPLPPSLARGMVRLWIEQRVILLLRSRAFAVAKSFRSDASCCASCF